MVDPVQDHKTAPMPAAVTAATWPVPACPIRMVALDLDGTLLRTDKRLSRRNVAAVRQAAALGVRVVIASARPPRSVREIYGLLGLDTFQINYNGALIHDPVRSRHVEHTPLAGGLARQIVEHVRQADGEVVVSLEVLDKWYTDRVDATLLTETARTFQPDAVAPLEGFFAAPVTKLMFLAPAARMTRIVGMVRQRWRGQVGLAISDHHLLQVTAPAVNKAAALQTVCRHYGIEREAVLAIGDAPNDVAMLRWAGIGLAVENGWPQAHAAADALIPANDRDGVAAALKHYVLER